MIETESVFPNDDGKLKRAWLLDSDKRGDSASDRVVEVFKDRPWIGGEVKVTTTNSQEDVNGFDMFVPMDSGLVRKLGIKQLKYGVPVQVKSNDHAVTKFLRDHRLYKSGKPIFRKGEYIFTFNGQNPKDLILADMVGQMIVLAQERISEADFLAYLAGTLGDSEAVERWIENREIIKDSWWYKDLLI